MVWRRKTCTQNTKKNKISAQWWMCKRNECVPTPNRRGEHKLLKFKESLCSVWNEKIYYIWIWKFKSFTINFKLTTLFFLLFQASFFISLRTLIQLPITFMCCCALPFENHVKLQYYIWTNIRIIFIKYYFQTNKLLN